MLITRGQWPGPIIKFRAGARPYPLVLAVVLRPSVPALPMRSPIASGERLMLASPRFSQNCNISDASKKTRSSCCTATLCPPLRKDFGSLNEVRTPSVRADFAGGYLNASQIYHDLRGMQASFSSTSRTIASWAVAISAKPCSVRSSSPDKCNNP